MVSNMSNTPMPTMKSKEILTTEFLQESERLAALGRQMAASAASMDGLLGDGTLDGTDEVYEANLATKMQADAAMLTWRAFAALDVAEDARRLSYDGVPAELEATFRERFGPAAALDAWKRSREQIKALKVTDAQKELGRIAEQWKNPFDKVPVHQHDLEQPELALFHVFSEHEERLYELAALVIDEETHLDLLSCLLKHGKAFWYPVNVGTESEPKGAVRRAPIEHCHRNTDGYWYEHDPKFPLRYVGVLEYPGTAEHVVPLAIPGRLLTRAMEECTQSLSKRMEKLVCGKKVDRRVKTQKSGDQYRIEDIVSAMEYFTKKFESPDRTSEDYAFQPPEPAGFIELKLPPEMEGKESRPKTEETYEEWRARTNVEAMTAEEITYAIIRGFLPGIVGEAAKSLSQVCYSTGKSPVTYDVSSSCQGATPKPSVLSESSTNLSGEVVRKTYLIP